jgi:hypothetical protein
MTPDSRTESRASQLGRHVTTAGAGPKTIGALVVCAASAAPRAHHVSRRSIMTAAVTAALVRRPLV